MRQKFDERDAEILQLRIAEWQKVEGPRVGDFVHLPDGTRRRFTHDWGDSLQTTRPGWDESFYFAGAYMSFSGSLDNAIDKSTLRDTGTMQDGSAWFFHHHEVRAEYGVHVSVPCRVYEVAP